FQAEDGIRDFHVTGVQTCALPIYKGRSQSRRARHTGLSIPPEASGERTGPCSRDKIHGCDNPATASGPEGEPRIRPARCPVPNQIGRASCRERGEIRGGGVELTKQ